MAPEGWLEAAQLDSIGIGLYQRQRPLTFIRKPFNECQKFKGTRKRQRSYIYLNLSKGCEGWGANLFRRTPHTNEPLASSLWLFKLCPSSSGLLQVPSVPLLPPLRAAPNHPSQLLSLGPQVPSGAAADAV